MTDLESCVAVCRQCTDDLGAPAVQAFSSEATHDTWVASHARWSGHDVRTVPGHPASAVAWQQAFGGAS